MLAERVMSSYEELVQEPIKATLSSVGQSFLTTSSLNLEIGVAKSGVKGPLMWGSSSDRFYKRSVRSVCTTRLSTETHDLDALVVLGTLISLQVVLESLGIVGDSLATGSVEVVDHAVVEGEDGRRRANLGTHVANGGHTRAGERLDTGASVLDDSASATLDGEDASDLEDDIWAQVECLMLVNMIGSTHPWG